MCSEEPIFVVKSTPQSSLICVTPEGAAGVKMYKGRYDISVINSKPKLTIYHNFHSFISRNEHERPVLSPRFDQPHSITYFAMQRRSVFAEVKPSPCKNVPWTSPYMGWYVFHLHRWTDSRPHWRQLQRGTLGKSCAKVQATSDGQNVFLLERQRQAPFYIHGNHYASVHACSDESLVLYHFIEVCRNIRRTHRELQTKHLGSAYLSIPL